LSVRVCPEPLEELTVLSRIPIAAYNGVWPPKRVRRGGRQIKKRRAREGGK